MRRQINFTRKATKDENGLNKLEAAWLVELNNRGWLTCVQVHGITLKLADDTRYTPDFSAVDETTGRWKIYEVKGFMREDAFLKLKIAARMFPMLDFVLVTRPGGMKGGEWLEKEVQP